MAAVHTSIAVVDDEESVRRALERLLASAGYDVVTFDSGSAFLDSLHAFEPACVVLDLHMPMPNGFEVLETLLRDGRGLPVVVISAEHNELIRERVAERGACTFLRKPVEDSVLLEAVRSALD